MGGIDRGGIGVGACGRGERDARDAPSPRSIHDQDCLSVDGAFHLTQAIALEHIEKAQQVALREGSEKQLFGVPPLHFAVKSRRR